MSGTAALQTRECIHRNRLRERRDRMIAEVYVLHAAYAPTVLRTQRIRYRQRFYPVASARATQSRELCLAHALSRMLCGLDDKLVRTGEEDEQVEEARLVEHDLVEKRKENDDE